MTRYVFASTILVVSLWAAAALAQTLPLMRISVENSDRHVQTRAVRRFADEIRERLRDRIDVRFYANARLFRDQDIVQALGQGRVEMAVPGTWHVSRFEPNVEIFLLPLFYGRPAQANYSAVDGAVGKTIAGRLEGNLRLKVVGRWIDLGHAHLFGTGKKILRHEDIQGLRVRVAGGAANELRIQAFGGRPTIIPWPDLPEYLQQGRVDAVLTSYETVQSAMLWEKGIRHAFEDREYFPQYVPLVRLSFWKKLPQDVQRMVTETWEKHVDVAREEAARAQTDAKSTLVKNGVKVVIPDRQRMEAWRRKILAVQDEFVERLKIDPELVRTVMEGF
jgi:TRAP-type C4-dicarboxylate transport system substrate-binding protein